MAKIYGYFEYDDSLTPGQAEDGGLSQLLFDSEGKLSDHASFHPTASEDEDRYSHDAPSPTDNSDLDADAQAAALLILAVIGAAAGGYVLIRKATPTVQRMINERALPAVQLFWKKVRGQGSGLTATRTGDGEVSIVPEPANAPGDDEAPGTDLAAAKPYMSAEEWYARFRAIFEARKFADEQWTQLSSVQVADDRVIAELQSEMAHNRPEAVVRQVTSMLEAAREIGADASAQPMPIEVERDLGQRP